MTRTSLGAVSVAAVLTLEAGGEALGQNPCATRRSTFRLYTRTVPLSP